MNLIQAQIQKADLDKGETAVAESSPNKQVDELFAVWDGNGTPGAAVAVVRDGVVLYKKGYGMANLEYDIPITPSSIFHIASVSKQFTVFSILLLQSEGKLDLDDDVRKYLPEVPDFGQTITLRHLAAHTSGLRDQWALLALAGWRLDDVITREHILKLVSRQEELNFAPGDQYLYCNTGYTLLAEIVSRVSGKSFAEFTKANIFGPLQMNHTLFYDDHEKIVKNRTYSYHMDFTGFKKSVLSYANVGATSLFTTVEDLSLWVENFSELTIGNSEIVRIMNTPSVLNDGTEFGGALGQFVGTYKGLNEIAHGGADAGYRSYLGRYPDQNFSVIVLSNSALISADRMAHQIVDIYLEEQFKPEEERSESAGEAERSESAGEEFVLDRNTLASYLGEYELQPGVIVIVTEENGQLFAEASGQEIVKLNPITKTEFEVEGIEAKVVFVPGDNNKVDLLKLYMDEQIQEAHRMLPFDKTAVNLSEYTGRFYSEELATVYDMKILEGKLVAQHIRLSDIHLSPIKQDGFSGDAWFFGQIEFVRGEDNAISGCKVSSVRVKNVYFKKLDSPSSNNQ